MLRELHISNLAVIEDVTIELAEGLNCFTGQTGAGKSLILGAFEILLGLRGGGAAEMIRPGADEARVSGLFELHGAWLAEEVGRLADQSLQPGEQLLITRKFFASGRSSISVNGRPATAPMVKQIGELLVDVHGQHDHQYLLKPSNQLQILDAFGKSLDLRQRYGHIHADLRDLRERHGELTASRTLRRQQLELYEFQADELDKAELSAGEYAELRARHTLLSNVQKIKKDAGAAHAALYDSEGSVVERLHMIVHVLRDLTELDGSLSETAEMARNAAASLQDTAFELGRYVDRLDLDPAELTEVEERLNLLNRMVAKYTDAPASSNDDPVQALLDYRQQIERQIIELRGQNEDLADMEQRITGLRKELGDVGTKLTTARKAAGKKLKPLVQAQLAELGMAEAEFEVAFESVADADSAASGPSGGDSIEMLVRTNPGQPARPLRKIASGGELSRIMLAIKSILAQADRVSVLVFDEIDANVGGRMGTVIGAKLRALTRPAKFSRDPKASASGGQQVLCITHLPQIAAFGDRHLRIAKSVEGKGKDKQTRTSVTPLAGEQRIEELAEMLAGKQASQITRQQAREMLASAVS